MVEGVLWLGRFCVGGWQCWKFRCWQVDMSQLIGFHLLEFSNFRLWVLCVTRSIAENLPQNGRIVRSFCDIFSGVHVQLHYVAYGAQHSKMSSRGITAKCAGYRRIWSLRSTGSKNRLCGKLQNRDFVSVFKTFPIIFYRLEIQKVIFWLLGRIFRRESSLLWLKFTICMRFALFLKRHQVSKKSVWLKVITTCYIYFY